MSNLIVLRAFQDDDVPLLEDWLHRSHVTPWFDDPQGWLDEIEQRRGRFSFIHHFIVESDGKPIGFCQFYEYVRSGEDWHGDLETEGVYSIDYLIGDAASLGKGNGKAVVGALVERIAATPNAARIIVQPEPENKASCGALLANGFSFDAERGLYVLEMT